MKYRKKPVVIEAFQMTPLRRIDNSKWPEWMHRAWQEDREAPGSLYPTEEGTGDGTLSIGTLEGQHLVSWGDWIIQGIKGELYPCKPDIFAATYEPVTDTDTSDRREEMSSESVVDLRYCLYAAHDAGVNTHPQQAMQALGISYQFSIPQSVANQWWFINCRNVPDPLPPYLSEMVLDYHKCVGLGFTAAQADAALDRREG